MGLLQATEVVKLIIGAGEPLIGRLLLYEALGATFTELKVRRDPECPICSRDPGRSPTRRWASSRTTRRSAPRRAGLPRRYGDGIKIPPVAARPSVGGEKEVSAERRERGRRAALARLESHPATESQLLSAEGELNRYVNVYLNDEDVRVLDGWTPPSATATLVILPAMAGGAGRGSAPSMVIGAPRPLNGAPKPVAAASPVSRRAARGSSRARPTPRDGELARG